MLRRPLRALPVLLLLACDGSDESGGFISLDNVCIGYAETACAAQQHCCEGDQDLAACETRVLKACEPVRYELTSQTSLSFDGEGARKELDELALELDACGDLPPLSRFFEGGADQGTPCTEDSSCSSFACQETCQAPPPAPLCDL